ncbi:TetR family transcriptional regulator [Blastococcus sp. CT_GayMR16]|uniref:TetR family transcriptional regulator n=1 Tax=Blastococcus sp. CT_GayMR16 TaxID=2559607 RepID=UPI00142FEC35|nr:TetR family transcriptional regulator [Blastococcus sp. CT_GayMR16]
MSTPTRKNSPRKRRARGSISAEEILLGAYELASEESLDALSMPRLAQRLDVGVTSIYWYFRSKEELLDTMTERAMAEFDRSFDLSPNLPWDDYVRTYFCQFREVFRTNGLLCDLIVMRTGPLTPEATRIAAQRIDLVLDVLVKAGFTPDAAMYAYSALSVFSRGHLFLERSWSASGRPESASEAFASTPGLTVLTAMAQPHTMSMTSDEDFEFGLENSIRGLRLLLDEESDEPCVARARSAKDAVPAG